MDVTADWYWEGNVVEAIARFLTQDGWAIVGHRVVGSNAIQPKEGWR